MSVPEPLCLDLKSAAASLGISVWTLRRYVEDGLIPTVKFPSPLEEYDRGLVRAMGLHL
jgi:predicted site-specific integrase-resolvase